MGRDHLDRFRYSCTSYSAVNPMAPCKPTPSIPILANASEAADAQVQSRDDRVDQRRLADAGCAGDDGHVLPQQIADRRGVNALPGERESHSLQVDDRGDHRAGASIDCSPVTYQRLRSEVEPARPLLRMGDGGKQVDLTRFELF